MIRVGLPTPMLLRLRLRAHLAANRLSRQTQDIRTGVLATINNDLAVIRRIPRLLTRHAESVTQTEDIGAMLEEFDNQYQNLVDLLCWSAKDGVHTSQAARYHELRQWFIEHYESVRPVLIEQLKTEPDDFVPVGNGARRSRDAFESLFLPEHVESIINSENVITRIMRTRTALDVCREAMDN